MDQTAKVLVLSESQQTKRKEAGGELKKSNYIDDDEMNKRVVKWLN